MLASVEDVEQTVINPSKDPRMNPRMNPILNRPLLIDVSSHRGFCTGTSTFDDTLELFRRP